MIRPILGLIAVTLTIGSLAWVAWRMSGAKLGTFAAFLAAATSLIAVRVAIEVSG